MAEKVGTEERFPLLLYFVESDQNLSKNNKRLFFDKGRCHGINNGASAVFTEWPNYISTCSVVTIISGLFFFMMVLLLLSSSMSAGYHRLPRCARRQEFGNRTIHLVHGPEAWTQNQLEYLYDIFRFAPGYQIHLVLLQGGKNAVVTTTEEIATSATTTSRTTIRSTAASSKATSKLPEKRNKRSLEKRLEKLDLNIRMSAKKLLDMLMMHHKLNFTDFPHKPKHLTLSNILTNKTNVVLENRTLSELFFATPLRTYHRYMRKDMQMFAIRVWQLWNFGGITFDLYKDPSLNSAASKEFAVNPKQQEKRVKRSEFVVENTILNYEKLPATVVTADDEGGHMETKTKCHAFVGEIINNLRKVGHYRNVHDLMRKSLKLYCKFAVADKKYCSKIIFVSFGYIARLMGLFCRYCEMKIVALWLLVVGCVFLVDARQLRRKVILEHVGPIYNDYKYVNCSESLRRFDRNKFLMNLTVVFPSDVNYDLMISLQIFKFSNNMYKETAIQFTGNICDYLRTVHRTLTAVYPEKFIHYMRSCPLKKGKYYIHNVGSDDVDVSFVPLWRGSVLIRAFRKDNQLIIFNQTTYFNIQDL